MTGNFQIKFLKIKKWTNLIGWPIVLLSAGLWYISLWYILLTLVLMVPCVLINCLWFVPTGNVGFLRVMAKQRRESYKDGWNLLVPVVSDTYLLDVTVQTKDITDMKKVLSRNNIKIEATLTYQLESDYADIIFRQMGADYYTTHVAKWVDATFDTMVSKLTYPHFQAHKAEIEEWATKLVQAELASRSSDMTEELLPTMSFDFTKYTMEPQYRTVPNPAKDPRNPAHATLPDFVDIPEMEIVMVGDGESEEIQKFNLVEDDDTLKGVNLFKNVSIKINKVEFEDTYEQARAKVAVAKAQVAEAEEKKKQSLILADAKKAIRIKEGEGEAEYTRLTKSALGEMLRQHPEILKEVLAENFPKVFGGGATPVINLDEMLGTKPIITK
jgi:hypothetical protein